MRKDAHPRAQFLREMDARHRLTLAAIVAVISFLCEGKLFLATRFLVSWDAFSLMTIVLAWIVLFMEDPYEVRRNARIQDGSLTFLFSVVISAALISLLAVGFLLETAKSLPKTQLAGHIVVSVGTIILSWGLVHTLFAMRYAHLYYFNARQKGPEHASGGLEFPGDNTPDYLDFAYFSFVVGMTCQVSDVQVSSSGMRRLTLLHGLISFCFNTAILAMFVNIVASLV